MGKNTASDVLIVDGEPSKKKLKGVILHMVKNLDQVCYHMEDGTKLFSTHNLEQKTNFKLRGTWFEFRDEHWDEDVFHECFNQLYEGSDKFKELVDDRSVESGAIGKYKTSKYGGNGAKDLKKMTLKREQRKSESEDDKDINYEFAKLQEIGVVNESNGKFMVRYGKLKGTCLQFARSVEAIEGPEESVDIDRVKEGWNHWMMDKIGKEWFDFINHLLGPDDLRECITSLYNSHDEFGELVHDKYEQNEELLEGNTDKKGRSGGESSEPNDLSGWGEEHGTTEEVRSNHEKRARGLDRYEKYDKRSDKEVATSEEDEGHVEDTKESQGDENEDGEHEDRLNETGNSKGEGGLNKFVAENGTTDTVRPESHGSSGHTESVNEKRNREAESEGDNDEVEVGEGGVSDTFDGVGENGGGETKGGLSEFAEEYGTADDIGHKSMPKPVDEIIHGNSVKVLQKLGKGYIDTCITSPPYWQLRDYEGDIEDQWDDGEWNGQLGHEPTPDLFAKHIADIFDGVYRVLKPGGSLWLNMGDTYGGKSGGHYDEEDYDGGSIGNKGNRPDQMDASAVPEKCLAMIPERIALELMKRGWILRNKVVWAKQVVFEDDTVSGITMPTAVSDRMIEKAAEPIYHFVKQKNYYYDLDSIRRPHKTTPRDTDHYGEDAKMTKTEKHGSKENDLSRNFNEKEFYHPEGANLPRVWQVNLQQSGDEHYAAYPDKLVERPIKATCPEDGIVLDPFAGTGTTLKIAAEMGRHYLGIEFSDKYIEIARKNVPKSRQMSLASLGQ